MRRHWSRGANGVRLTAASGPCGNRSADAPGEPVRSVARVHRRKGRRTCWPAATCSSTRSAPAAWARSGGPATCAPAPGWRPRCSVATTPRCCCASSTSSPCGSSTRTSSRPIGWAAEDDLVVLTTGWSAAARSPTCSPTTARCPSHWSGCCSTRRCGAGRGARRRVVHRDVKPANLLLEPHRPRPPAPAGRPTSASPRPDDPVRAPGGRAAGTDGYLAPERLRGAAGRTPRQDLYAAGVVAVELLTGRRPGPRNGARTGPLRPLLDVDDRAGPGAAHRVGRRRARPSAAARRAGPARRARRSPSPTGSATRRPADGVGGRS